MRSSIYWPPEKKNDRYYIFSSLIPWQWWDLISIQNYNCYNCLYIIIRILTVVQAACDQEVHTFCIDNIHTITFCWKYSSSFFFDKYKKASIEPEMQRLDGTHPRPLGLRNNPICTQEYFYTVIFTFTKYYKDSEYLLHNPSSDNNSIVKYTRL